MKVRRTEKIKVNTFRVGDVIRFKLSDGEKVEMLAVKEESDGMIFSFADCLAKEYSMNEQNTNEGGWDASDLRKKLNGEILDRFPRKIRKLLLPFENGDMLRLPTEKEIFGSNPCGEDEPESVSQWKPMKQRKNRIASQGLNGGWEWYWLQNRVPNSAAAFANVYSNGAADCNHEMGLLKLRELKILEKIKEYEDMDPDTLITSSVLDMRVPGKVGKTGKKEDGKVQTMGMYSRDTPFARILKLQDALYKTQGRIAAVAGALRAAEEADRRMELERKRLELLRIRATGEVPGGGDEDGSIHQ